MSKLRDWAGLPDVLLHSIVELLGSFPDCLAFAATCPAWRSAFLSYPSKSTLYALFPPLLLDPNVSLCPPRPFQNVARNTSVPKRPCYVIDLTSQERLLCSEIPLFSIDHRNNLLAGALDNFDFDFGFKGASFGHMIFCSNKTCFLFDVFTGIEISSPPLPVDENRFRYGIDLTRPPPLPGLPVPVGNTKFCYGAALTGPLASPNPHLTVYTKSSNFFWPIGSSDSWSKCSPRTGPLTKFVVFKDQVFGMGSDRRLFMVHLTPHIHLQDIPISWGGRNSMTEWHPRLTWLVVCGDMLLMVGCRSDSSGAGPAFEAYHLDTSSEPTKWVKVESLGKWTIFISNDLKVEALSCMNPERWGGRSNCVYCYDSCSGHLVAIELGKPLLGDDATRFRAFICVTSLHAGNMDMALVPSCVQPTWVVPSMFS